MYLQKVSGLTLTLTIYLNEIKHMKPATCHYQLPTHSTGSYYLEGDDICSQCVGLQCMPINQSKNPNVTNIEQ